MSLYEMLKSNIPRTSYDGGSMIFFVFFRKNRPRPKQKKTRFLLMFFRIFCFFVFIASLFFKEKQGRTKKTNRKTNKK